MFASKRKNEAIMTSLKVLFSVSILNTTPTPLLKIKEKQMGMLV